MNGSLLDARVERVVPLTDSILQLTLAPKTYVPYEAGQYLQIVFNQEAYSYSIANAPLGSHKYELHIRHSAENPVHQALLADIRDRGAVTLHVPLGNCHLQRLHPEKPILFIAGGTGFAPVKAMIEQLLAEGSHRCFELYWGARLRSDLYFEDKVLHWQQHVRSFQYFSHVSEAKNASLISNLLKRHEGTLHEWQMVISGPFDMVYKTRDHLVSQGACAEDLYSDAFEFKE